MNIHITIKQHTHNAFSSDTNSSNDHTMQHVTTTTTNNNNTNTNTNTNTNGNNNGDYDNNNAHDETTYDGNTNHCVCIHMFVYTHYLHIALLNFDLSMLQ